MESKNYYLYLIYSARRDRYYIGSTSNLERRLADHNAGRTKSTRRGKPWVLKYYEEYGTNRDARAREAQLKRKKSRKYLEYLIELNG